MVALHLLFLEVPGEAEAVLQQVLEHSRELLRSSARRNFGHDLVGALGERRPARELVRLEVEGFNDEGGERAFGATEHAGVGGAGSTGSGVGGKVKARLGRIDLDRRYFEFGLARCLSV